MNEGTTRMRSWQACESSPLIARGVVSRAFLALGLRDFRAAARYVCHLPYGRNRLPIESCIVLREGRGTCSTKHALLRRLAIEQELEIVLMLGIYLMNERNTPGVGRVLQRQGIAAIPEAHCYLRTGDTRIDITRPVSGSEWFLGFAYEEEIAPDRISGYKTELHQRFLRQWIEQNHHCPAFSFTDLWRIREACIAALSE